MADVLEADHSRREESSRDDVETASPRIASSNGSPGSRLPAKILLDEYCSSFGAVLSKFGWDVRTVHDYGLDRDQPYEIVEVAKMHDMIMVSRDGMLERVAAENGAKTLPISHALASAVMLYPLEEEKQEQKPFFAHPQ